MATKPILNLPEWASTEPVGTNVIEPTSRKTTGYTKNLQGIPEKPTYQELNFLLKSNYEWTQYLEDATDEINLITVTAGEALTANDVVRLSGGSAYKADSSSESDILGIVGIVTQTTAINDPAIIAVRYWNGFNGLSVGSIYYVGTSGSITTTKPSIAFEVGIAVSSTQINLNLNKVFKTQYNQTNAGGIVTWTDLTIGTNQKVRLIINGQFSGVLYVHGHVASTQPDYSARYGLAVDSWIPSFNVSLLSSNLQSTQLNVYWDASSDLYVENLGASRDFDFTLMYNGTYNFDYEANPIPS